MNNYIKIIRPANLLIIILTQFFLRFFIIDTYFGLSGLGPAFSLAQFILLVLATILIAAGGYVINDYFDQKADAVNKPEKRIAGEKIHNNLLLRYYRVLTILGIMLGLSLAILVNYWLLGLVFPAVAAMLWSYSSRYQKTVLAGNVMIAMMSAMVILIEWLFEFFALKAEPVLFVEVFKQLNSIHVIVFAFTLFAFFVTLIREIVKDIEDMEGDKQQGFKTLVIVSGVAKAKNVALAFHLITIALLAFCQYLLYIQNLHYVFWYITIAVQLLFLFVLYYLVIARTKKDFHFLSNAYKIIMVAGILSMQIFYISF